MFALTTAICAGLGGMAAAEEDNDDRKEQLARGGAGVKNDRSAVCRTAVSTR